jgi:hypothetical protein
MSVALLPALLSVLLFSGMLVCLELGFRLGRKQAMIDSGAHEGVGAIDAAIFALLGLLLGFAFAGAMSRLDVRRNLLVSETNAISTAYARVDLLPEAERPEMHRLILSYLDARASVYDSLGDAAAVKHQLAKANTVDSLIWLRVAALSPNEPLQITSRLVAPAVNDMESVAMARTIALGAHLPRVIFALLFIAALLSALVAGHAMSKRERRSFMHVILFAALISCTVYTVMDLDDPSVGLIRIDPSNTTLRSLHNSLK